MRSPPRRLPGLVGALLWASLTGAPGPPPPEPALPAIHHRRRAPLFGAAGGSHCPEGTLSRPVGPAAANTELYPRRWGGGLHPAWAASLDDGRRGGLRQKVARCWGWVNPGARRSKAGGKRPATRCASLSPRGASPARTGASIPMTSASSGLKTAVPCALTQNWRTGEPQASQARRRYRSPIWPPV